MISQVLPRARRRAGLSLRQLAARAGTSHATVAAYEAGRKVPRAATVERLVGAAGFDLEVGLYPRPDDPEARGRELVEVLELAAAFPARHDDRLRAPVFGRR